jgi:hypothetical protein
VAPLTLPGECGLAPSPVALKNQCVLELRKFIEEIWDDTKSLVNEVNNSSTEHTRELIRLAASGTADALTGGLRKFHDLLEKKFVSQASVQELSSNLDMKIDALASRIESFANVQPVHSAPPTSGVGSSVPLLGAAASVRHDADEYQISDPITATESRIASPAPLSTSSGDAAVLMPTTLQDNEFHVDDKVRLHSLKTAALNERIGTVVDYIARSGRFGVHLHGELEPRAFRKENLKPYAFPTCSCELGVSALST